MCVKSATDALTTTLRTNTKTMNLPRFGEVLADGEESKNIRTLLSQEGGVALGGVSVLQEG
jgi:hypothetical protein